LESFGSLLSLNSCLHTGFITVLHELKLLTQVSSSLTNDLIQLFPKIRKELIKLESVSLVGVSILSVNVVEHELDFLESSVCLSSVRQDLIGMSIFSILLIITLSLLQAFLDPLSVLDELLHQVLVELDLKQWSFLQLRQELANSDSRFIDFIALSVTLILESLQKELNSRVND